MSGTASKVTGLTPDSTTLPTGGTLRLRWALLSGADDYRAEGSTDAGKTWASWGRTGGPTASFSKGGLADGSWQARVVARRSGSDIAGSASDPVAVRVGPAPVTQPAPAPAPAPVPTPAPAPAPAPTAADLAALRDRVAALEARAASPIQASGTLALVVQGQVGEVPATATLTLTPVAAPAK